MPKKLAILILTLSWSSYLLASPSSAVSESSAWVCKTRDTKSGSKIHGATVTLAQSPHGALLSVTLANGATEVTEVITTRGDVSFATPDASILSTSYFGLMHEALLHWVEMTERLAPHSPQWQKIATQFQKTATASLPFPATISLSLSLGYRRNEDGTLGGILDLSATADQISFASTEKVLIPKSATQWSALSTPIPLKFEMGEIGKENGEKVAVVWKKEPFLPETVIWSFSDKDTSASRTITCETADKAVTAARIKEISSVSGGKEDPETRARFAEKIRPLVSKIMVHPANLDSEDPTIEARSLVEIAVAESCGEALGTVGPQGLCGAGTEAIDALRENVGKRLFEHVFHDSAKTLLKDQKDSAATINAMVHDFLLPYCEVPLTSLQKCP